jgi:hypothetical protein
MTSGYSTMTREEAQREIKRMKKATTKIVASRYRAKAFLISAGILNKDGKNLAAKYR